MSEVMEFWDSVAPRYDSQAVERVGVAHERRFVDGLEYYKPSPGDRVLNVWSRTGKLGRYLLGVEPDIRLTHLELSGELLTVAKRNYPDQNFSQCALDELPLPSESHDWVISLEALEHAPSPRRFLSEIHRVLKPGAFLILSCPPATAEPLAYLAHKLLGFHGEGPHRFLSSGQVIRLLRETGFQLVDHKGTVLIPFGPQWLQRRVWPLEKYIQRTPLRELCIRQFFFTRRNQ